MSGPFNRGGTNSGSSQGVFNREGIDNGSGRVFPSQDATASPSGGASGQVPAIIDVSGTPVLASGITAQEILNLLGASTGDFSAQDLVNLINAGGDVTASITGSTVLLNFNGAIQDNELASTFVKTVDGNVPNASGNVVSTIVVQNENGSQASSGIQAIRLQGTAVADPTIQGSTAVFTIDQADTSNFVTNTTFSAHVQLFNTLSTDFQNYRTSNDAAVAARATNTQLTQGLATKADTADTVLDTDVHLNSSNEVEAITVGTTRREVAQPDVSGLASTATTVIDTDVQLDSTNQITGLMVGDVIRQLASVADLSTVTGSNGTSATNVSAITFTTSGDPDTVVSVTDDGSGTATVNIQIQDDAAASLLVDDFRTGTAIARQLNRVDIRNDHDVELHFVDQSTPYTIRTIDTVQFTNGVLQLMSDGVNIGSSVDIGTFVDNRVPNSVIRIDINGNLQLNGASAAQVQALIIPGFTTPSNVTVPLVNTDIAAMGYVENRLNTKQDTLTGFTVPADVAAPTMTTDIASMAYADEAAQRAADSLATELTPVDIFGQFTDLPAARAAIPTGVRYDQTNDLLSGITLGDNPGEWHRGFNDGDNFRATAIHNSDTRDLVFEVISLGDIEASVNAQNNGGNTTPVTTFNFGDNLDATFSGSTVTINAGQSGLDIQEDGVAEGNATTLNVGTGLDVAVSNGVATLTNPGLTIQEDTLGEGTATTLNVGDNLDVTVVNGVATLNGLPSGVTSGAEFPATSTENELFLLTADGQGETPGTTGGFNAGLYIRQSGFWRAFLRGIRVEGETNTLFGDGNGNIIFSNSNDTNTSVTSAGSEIQVTFGVHTVTSDTITTGYRTGNMIFNEISGRLYRARSDFAGSSGSRTLTDTAQFQLLAAEPITVNNVSGSGVSLQLVDGVLSASLTQTIPDPLLVNATGETGLSTTQLQFDNSVFDVTDNGSGVQTVTLDTRPTGSFSPTFVAVWSTTGEATKSEHSAAASVNLTIETNARSDGSIFPLDATAGTGTRVTSAVVTDAAGTVTNLSAAQLTLSTTSTSNTRIIFNVDHASFATASSVVVNATAVTTDTSISEQGRTITGAGTVTQYLPVFFGVFTDDDASVGVAEHQRVAYTGTRSNVVTSGIDEQVVLRVRSDYDGGPAMRELSAVLSQSSTALLTARTITTIGFRTGQSLFFTTYNIPAANQISVDGTGTRFDAMRQVLASINGVTLNAQTVNTTPATVVVNWDSTTNTFTTSSFNGPDGTDIDFQIALNATSAGVTYSNYQQGAANGPASYNIIYDNDGNVLGPISTSYVLTNNATFVGRDTVSFLTTNDWDLRDGPGTSDTSVNYATWNDWVGNYIRIDTDTTTEEAFRGTTQCRITFTDGNTADFMITPSTDTEAGSTTEASALVDSVISQMGTPDPSVTASMRIDIPHIGGPIYSFTVAPNATASDFLNQAADVLIADHPTVTKSSVTTITAVPSSIELDYSAAVLNTGRTGLLFNRINGTSFGVPDGTDRTIRPLLTIATTDTVTTVVDNLETVLSNNAADEVTVTRAGNIITITSTGELDFSLGGNATSTAWRQDVGFATEPVITATVDGTVTTINTFSAKQLFGNHEEMSITIDTNQGADLQQAVFVSGNDGTNVIPHLRASIDGEQATGSILTSYRAIAPSGTEAFMFNSSVSSAALSDLDSVINMFVTGVNNTSNNQGGTIRFTASDDRANSRVDLIGATTGDVSGTWDFQVDNGASTNAGNITFTTSTVTEGATGGDISELTESTAPYSSSRFYTLGAGTNHWMLVATSALGTGSVPPWHWRDPVSGWIGTVDTMDSTRYATQDIAVSGVTYRGYNFISNIGANVEIRGE